MNTLWVAFAKFYEEHGDLDNARVIFDKATQVRCDANHVTHGIAVAIAAMSAAMSRVPVGTVPSCMLCT